MSSKSNQEPESKGTYGARPKTVVPTTSRLNQGGVEGKGSDIAKSATKVPQPDFDRNTWHQMAILTVHCTGITGKLTELSEAKILNSRSSSSQHTSLPLSGIATGGNSNYSGVSKQNRCSTNHTEAPDSPGKPGTAETPSVSRLDDAVYTELDVETEQYIRRRITSGLRLDATKILLNIVKLIMSTEILFRTTDSKNIIDLEKVKNRLREFVNVFSDYEKMLLDLLLEIETLDKVASELGEFLSFDGKQEDLLDATHRIKVALTKIGDKSTSENRAVSRYYISAANLFRENETALTQAAENRNDQIGGGSFRLLQRLAFALKYGTLHEIIESMNVELKKLANGKLNGFLFYPVKDETDLKRRECSPFVRPPLAETIEEISRKVVDSDTTENVASKEITDDILDDIETLSNIFFSSYRPELKLQTIHSERDGDYIECDISKVTKLVSEGYQEQQLGVVLVHKKAFGVLHDYTRLIQDNGSLREENERLQRENADLRRQLHVLNQTSQEVNAIAVPASSRANKTDV